jgi:hypothetical protein
MDLFFNILRKFLVGVTTLVFTFVILYVPQNYNQIETVPMVEAQVPGVPSATEMTQLVNTGSNIAQEIKDKVLDPIAYHIAKTFISQMLRATVVWINSGFKGSPAFIQDLDKFLLDTADLAAGEYIKSLGEVGSIICKPFRINIQLALKLKYQKAREGKRVDECRLSGIVDNIENFIDGTVSRDKFWAQWIEVTSKPGTYTPYGQMLEAETAMNIYINGKKTAILKETDWGQGFLSKKVCEPVASAEAAVHETAHVNTTAATPSSNTAAVHEAAHAAPAAAPKEVCKIVTPGETIAASLNKALGASTDSLVAADEINEVIGALIGQIANQALTGAAGLLGLSVRGGYGGSNGDSYVDAIVNERQGDGNLFNDGISEVADRLNVQIEYRDMAISYIPRLLAVSNDSTKEKDLRDRALISYSDAIMVRDTTNTHIAFLRPLVERYNVLDKEFATATDDRKAAIRQEQSDIISKGIQYRSYTEARMQLSEREWSDIIRLAQ